MSFLPLLEPPIVFSKALQKLLITQWEVRSDNSSHRQLRRGQKAGVAQSISSAIGKDLQFL